MSQLTRPDDLDRLLAQSDWLRRLAHGLVRDPHAAEDVVQDTWIAALRRAPRSSTGELRAWLASVASNFARRRGRDERLRLEREHDAAAVRESAADFGALLERAQLQRELADHVVALEEPHRSTIVLRYFDGLTLAELATRLDITPPAARQRVSRALARLRERLDRARGGDRAAWSALCLQLLDTSPHPTSALPWMAAAMTTKSKLALAAALVLVVLGVWWWRDPRSGASHAERAPTSSALAEEDSTRATDAATSSAPGEERIALVEEPSTRASAAPDVDDDHALCGIVVDERGAPVEGARIRASTSLAFELRTLDLELTEHTQPAGETQSAADGTFRLPVAIGRAHEVSVTHSRFAPATLGRRSAGEFARIELRRGGALAGRVTRGASRGACAGAHVKCFWLGNDHPDGARFEVTTTSDADGRYRFDGLPPGKLILDVDAEGEPASGWLKIVIETGCTLERDVHLEARAWLRGTVVDARTQAPISGAQVAGAWTFDKAVLTDANGAFALPFDALVGRSLRARAPAYGAGETPLASASRESDVDGLVIALSPARRVRGRIVDAQARPVEGAYVAACAYAHDRDAASWRAGRTDAEGRFAIGELRRDVLYTLFVQARGHGAVSYRLPPAKDDVDVVEMPDVELAAGAVVRGVVVDDEGTPVHGALVELKGANADRDRWRKSERDMVDTYLEGRHRHTDHRGRFTFDELPAGTFTAEFQGPQHRVVRGPSVELATGETSAVVRIVVPRGQSLAGQVVDRRGRAVARAHLQVYPDASGAQSIGVSTGDDGRFAVLGLPEGTCHIDVSTDHPRDVSSTSAFPAPARLTGVRVGSADVLVTLPDGAWLRGRVLEADEQALAGGWIHAAPVDGSAEVHGQIGADGSFAIVVTSDATYDVTAERELPSRGELRARSSGPSRSNGVRAIGGGPDIVVRMPR